MQRIIVEVGGERLDKFLAERMDCTRSQLKYAEILLNGKCAKSGSVLRAGDVVECRLQNAECRTLPEEIPLDVVLEDDYLMIINKPRGMVVHPGAGVKGGTLLNALMYLANSEERRANSECKIERGGIVHRLDKNTAGLMVVAKTATVQASLAAMFERHEVKRTYVGIVEGVLTGEGTIDKNIVRDPKRRTLYTVSTTPSPCGATPSFSKGSSFGGRRAITHFKVLQNFSKWSLVRFNLETGRTHQIRVHCKSIGHPIIGDPEYNPSSSIKGLSGQMLESVEIEFVHPMSNTPSACGCHPFILKGNII